MIPHITENINYQLSSVIVRPIYSLIYLHAYSVMLSNVVLYFVCILLTGTIFICDVFCLLRYVTSCGLSSFSINGIRNVNKIQLNMPIISCYDGVGYTG